MKEKSLVLEFSQFYHGFSSKRQQFQTLACKKKASIPARFDINSNVEKLLVEKLKDPASKHLKAKKLFDSDNAFVHSGINLKQFCSAMVQIKSCLGGFMDDTEEGYNEGKFF